MLTFTQMVLIREISIPNKQFKAQPDLQFQLLSQINNNNSHCGIGALLPPFILTHGLQAGHLMMWRARSATPLSTLSRTCPFVPAMVPLPHGGSAMALMQVGADKRTEPISDSKHNAALRKLSHLHCCSHPFPLAIASPLSCQTHAWYKHPLSNAAAGALPQSAALGQE